MAADRSSDSLVSRARRVGRSPADRVRDIGPDDASQLAVRLGRIGIVSQGVLNLLLAWVIAQVALGRPGEDASSQGALSQLAEQPFGVVLLILVAAGFLAYAVWQAVEVAGRGITRATLTNRLRAAAKAVLGVVLLVITARVAFDGLSGGGSGAGSGGQEQQATSTVMGWPGGQLLVGVAGLVVLGVGGYYISQGIRDGVRKLLEPGTPEWQIRLGRFGEAARGVAFGTVGALLVSAAWTYDPERSRGLDGALEELRSRPFGTVLVMVIALGFAAWGLFCLLTFRRRTRG